MALKIATKRNVQKHLIKFFPLSNSLNRKLKEFAAKSLASKEASFAKQGFTEKLEIVKERGEAAQIKFSGASRFRRRRRRNASELFSVYTAIVNNLI